MRFNPFSLLTCLLCFGWIATSQAQDADMAQLKGVLVQAGSSQALAFAAVSAFSPADSSRVAGTITENDGSFQFDVPAGTYYLLIRYLGHQDLVIPDVEVKAGQTMRDIGEVEMIEDGLTLEEVDIEVERSQMELKLDKRVFNVGQDLTNAGNNAADILNKVPSVSVDTEGNVSLRGSQGVRILVDGKPSALLNAEDMNALQRMQGDIIESIEVITNPSARYEAEGEAGIINIILKKNKKRGVNGSFGANAGYPTNLGASYSLNYRRENFNFFSNFGISYRKTPGISSSTQQFFDNEVLTDFYTSDTDRLRGGLGGNLQLGTDWFITPRDVLTGSLLYRRSSDLNLASVIYRDLDEDENLLNASQRDNTETSNNQNFETALNYKRTFEQEDRAWTIDFKYILDDDLELSDYVETGTANESPLLQRSSNTEYETNMLIQTDYVHPFNDSTKIEGGIRTTLRTIKNRFLVEEVDAVGSYFTLPDFDDELRYTENIYAAYVIGAAEVGNIGLQAGLRAELSDVQAALLKSETVNNQNYLNFFPSASASYQFSLKNQLQASYSRRLSRPYFRLLLPFSNFTDPRNNPVGNPTLLPEYTDSYEVSFLRYLSKGTFLASLYYRHTTGVIERLILPSENGTTIRFPVNLDQRNAVGLEFNGSYDLSDWWSINGDANFYRSRVEGSFQEVKYQADIFSWQGRFSSKFALGKSLNLQPVFQYFAPENNTQGRSLARYAFDLGASLEVFSGKGTLTLSGRDLFNTLKERRIIDLVEYQFESVSQRRLTRQVVLGFVYRLNQDKRR